MAEAARMEALEGRIYGGNGVSLAPVEACERISLRVENKALTSIGRALGVTLPAKPGKVAEKNGVAALWIGPDEWLIIDESDNEYYDTIEVGTVVVREIVNEHFAKGVISSGEVTKYDILFSQ